MRRRPDLIRPDLTPLIDIVFLLLVFFMAISSLEHEKTVLGLTLPELNEDYSPPDSRHHALEIAETRLALDGVVVTEVSLAERLPAFPRESIVSVYIDEECRFKRIATVLALLKKHGTMSIDLVVTRIP